MTPLPEQHEAYEDMHDVEPPRLTTLDRGLVVMRRHLAAALQARELTEDEALAVMMRMEHHDVRGAHENFHDEELPQGNAGARLPVRHR